MILIRIIGILIIFQVVWGCSEDETGTYDETLVFSNAYQVKVPSYQYTSGQNSYYVMGDTSYFNSEMDTLNTTPLLQWDTIGISIITAAIFTEPIMITNSEIVNTGDVVWQWHSGMESGSDGYVQYIEGRSVLHAETDSIDYEHQPTPLDEGDYYWAVWGWNQSGIKVWYSSRQLKFYVLN